MYDKLGALLSEALRTGEVPKSSEDSQKVKFFYVPEEEKNQNENENFSKSDENSNHEKSENLNQNSKSEQFSQSQNSKSSKENLNQKHSDFSRIFGTKKSQTGERIPKSKVKIIPENVKSALAFIGISENASFDEAKKIYREKLMYYHPDRRADNPVLQKVAKEKTAQLLENWTIIENWYSTKN